MGFQLINIRPYISYKKVLYPVIWDVKAVESTVLKESARVSEQYSSNTLLLLRTGKNWLSLSCSYVFGKISLFCMFLIFPQIKPKGSMFLYL